MPAEPPLTGAAKTMTQVNVSLITCQAFSIPGSQKNDFASRGLT